MKKAAAKPQTKWFILLCLFFFGSIAVKSAEAKTENKGSDTLTITATVPLQEGFARLIEKNSQVSLQEKALYPGEKVIVAVFLFATEEGVLRNHALQIILKKKTGEKLVSLEGKSDGKSQATFSFEIKKEWLGEYSLEVLDTNYPERVLVLEEKPVIFVLARPRASEEPEEKKIREKYQGAPSAENGTTATSSSLEVAKDRILLPQDIHQEKEFAEMRAGP